MKLRLLIILEATLGGIRKHVIDLINGMADKENVELYFVYSLNRADKIFIKNLSQIKNKCVTYHINMKRGFSCLTDIQALIKLAKLVYKINPDLIHMHGAKAGFLGRLTYYFSPGKRKYIYTPHGGSFHKFNSKIGIFYIIIERILARITDAVIGVSKFDVEQIKKYLKISNTKIKMIYNGINLKNFEQKSSITIIDKEGIIYKNHELNILWPALFLEAKGHKEFIELIGKNKCQLNECIRIYLAGNGPLEEQIQSMIKKHNLEKYFVFLGFVENLNDYYRNCDLVFLLSQNEVFGYVALESFLFSKPVFATKVGALNELIQNNFNGELFDKNNMFTIIERLNYFVSHKEELILMGENAKNYLINQFDLSKMISQTYNLYEEILSEKTNK